MRKFFFLIAVLFAVCCISAGEREDVAAAVKDFRIAQLNFDFDKLLALSDPAYEQINADGSRRTYADLQRMGQAFARIEQSDDLEVILESYWSITGKSFTPEQRELIRQAKDTEFGKNLAAEYKGAIAEVKASYARTAAGNANWSVTVTLNGSKADAVLDVPAVSDGVSYRTCYTLKKVDGKWLVVRNEHQGAVRK